MKNFLMISTNQQAKRKKQLNFKRVLVFLLDSFVEFKSQRNGMEFNLCKLCGRINAATLQPEYKIHKLCDILTIPLDKTQHQWSFQLALDARVMRQFIFRKKRIGPVHSWWHWFAWKKNLTIIISIYGGDRMQQLWLNRKNKKMQAINGWIILWTWLASIMCGLL